MCIRDRPYSTPKTETQTKTNPSKDTGKGVVRDVPKHLDGKRCFKCQGYGHFRGERPNKRALTIKEIEEIDQIIIEPYKKELEEEEEDTILAPEVGEFLVLKRALHTMEVLMEENQRKLIFHSWCAIQGKVCSLIIDGGSCTNVTSSYLIDKLKLPTIPHRQPYFLQWLKKENEVHVTKQALITYTIRTFKYNTHTFK